MTPMRFAAIAAVCLLIPTAGAPGLLARAHQRPNFSGRWVIVLPEKGAGQEQIIKHDDKTLSKTPVSERGGPAATYQIDGVEHRAGKGAVVAPQRRGRQFAVKPLLKLANRDVEQRRSIEEARGRDHVVR